MGMRVGLVGTTRPTDIRPHGGPTRPFRFCGKIGHHAKKEIPSIGQTRDKAPKTTVSGPQK